MPNVPTSASPLSRMPSAMRVKSPFSQSALFGFIASFRAGEGLDERRLYRGKTPISTRSFFAGRRWGERLIVVGRSRVYAPTVVRAEEERGMPKVSRESAKHDDYGPVET